MADSYTDVLNLILQRLDAIEAKLPKPVVPEPVKPTGGLYDFIRPVPVEPRHGVGIRMTSPDAAEALLRSKYCVRWNGDVALGPTQEDEAWEEIERLKSGDQALIAKYKDLDPEFAGFALNTGLIDPAKYDGFMGQAKRDAFIGYNVERFIGEQFGIDSKPSGDE